MDLSSADVKKIATGLGADLCGIASIDRFSEAPAGYHPDDVLPGCKSVIVLASRFLVSTLSSRSTVPYTIVRNELTKCMDTMSLNISYELEKRGVAAIPTGAIEPNNFDPLTNKFRGIISLKHAAVLAGLGKIGKNTLLINDQYGNMIWLSAVITSAALDPDPIAAYEGCIEGCDLCLSSCPVNALDGVSMDQRQCWDYAFGTEDGGEWRIKCYLCRKICPHCTGIP